MYQVCWKYFFICSFSLNLLKWHQQISNIKICIPVERRGSWIARQDRSMWRTLRPSAGQAQQWVSECPKPQYTCTHMIHQKLLQYGFVHKVLRRDKSCCHLRGSTICQVCKEQWFMTIEHLSSVLHHRSGTLCQWLLQTLVSLYIRF